MRIVVVGGGMQGFVIAKNLLARKEKPEVVVADVKQPGRIAEGAVFKQASVLDPLQVKELVRGADAVVLAVPSEIAHESLRNLVAEGARVADVSFTPEPPLSLDQEARKTGSVCLVDVGVAPGLSHVLVGSAYTELGGLDTARILVGGMPQNPPELFRHAVYFNPQDLLAEYVRPARARQNGQNISPSPMEVDPESFHDNEVGQLEAFLSDGLRSLLSSYPDVKEMAELTLRWPGHLETMTNLHKLGLLQNSQTCRAIASHFATRYPAESYPDFLLMVVEATRGGKCKSWRLIDRSTDGISAMSRTTGYTTAATAMLLAAGKFTEVGVHPPEQLGKTPHLVRELLADLQERGVKVQEVATALAT
jgi:lysine 6-dehydrogenase